MSSSKAGREKRRNKYAGISVILSFASLLLYYLFRTLNSRLIRLKVSRLMLPEESIGEETWLSRPLVSSLFLVSAALAVAALALSIDSLKSHPRRLYPLAFAIYGFATIFLMLL